MVTAVVVVAADAPGGGSPAMVGPEDPGAAPAPTPTPTATATATPAPVEETVASRAGTASPEAQSTADPDATPAPDPASTTVQVLDGGAGPAVTRQVADLLAEAGYDVVAVSTARCCYEVTTALWSPGGEAAAVALAEEEPRIAEIRENPNLSQDVDVHVVVGTDWSS